MLDPFAKKSKEHPHVDIIKEYGLIQEKKSTLSKAERDWVVYQFEKRFEKIDSSINLYPHLYGKYVRMDDRFEGVFIWSEDLAIKNRGRWVPTEITKEEYEEARR